MPEPATPPGAPPEAPPRDPLAPPQYVPMTPENDADHQLKQMISRRRKPAAPATPEAEAAKPGTAAAPAVSATLTAEPPKAPDSEPKPPAAGFNDAVAGVFGWKPTPKKKAEPKPEEPAAPEAPAEPAAAEPPAPKTIVGKKKAAPAPPAAPDITQITTAATTAAVRALQGSPKTDTAQRRPEADLAPEDLYDYEVAVKLAEINPKYKDAPKVILDHVKKSEAYAARWETANPGKVFNLKDDEHNEFYESLEKPWSDHEFRKAATKLETAEETEQIRREVGGKIKALEQDNARLELNPIIERTFIAAAGHMARQLEVHDKLKAAGDFDKFAEEDPITAEAMASALGPIQPLIEAIVQIDDPKGRFPVDEKNPAHQAWLQLLADKEAQFQGVESTDGKMFATRIAFSRMNDAQRARHWYLTPDHLVTELVQEAIATAAEKVKTEKERQKKIALSLGYVLPTDTKPASAKTAATNGAIAAEHAAALPGVQKPVSPSVGSGAKIDTKGGATPTGRAATLAAMGDVLFRAGNPVP